MAIRSHITTPPRPFPQFPYDLNYVTFYDLNLAGNIYWQRQSPLVQRWQHVLLNPKSHARARKRAIIAVARRLLVDLWRWRTGQMSLKDLGWIPMN